MDHLRAIFLTCSLFGGAMLGEFFAKKMAYLSSFAQNRKIGFINYIENGILGSFICLTLHIVLKIQAKKIIKNDGPMDFWARP